MLLLPQSKVFACIADGYRRHHHEARDFLNI
jgi:hypothetical protein